MFFNGPICYQLAKLTIDFLKIKVIYSKNNDDREINNKICCLIEIILYLDI